MFLRIFIYSSIFLFAFENNYLNCMKYEETYKNIKIIFDFQPEEHYIYSVKVLAHGLMKRSRTRIQTYQSMRLTTYTKNNPQLFIKRVINRCSLIKNIKKIEVFYLRKAKG